VKNTFVLGTLFLVACSSLDSAESTHSTVSAVQPDEYLAQTAQRECMWGQNCLGVADFIRVDCVTQQSSASSAYDEAIKAGRIKYDAKKAAACLQQPAPACSWDPFPVASDCDSVFAGTLAAGESCSLGEECASGNCGGSTCPPTCQAEGDWIGRPCPCTGHAGLTCINGACAFRNAGAACAQDSDCERRLRCKGGTCALAAEGDVCGTASRPCGPGTGLYCDPGTCWRCNLGTCRARLAAGESCVWGDLNEGYTVFGADTVADRNPCAEPLTCIGGGFDALGNLATGTCGPLVDVGGACVPSPPMPSQAMIISGCRDGLYCDQTGHCRMPPSTGPCLGGAFCDARTAFCDASGQCQPLEANGLSCTGDGMCASGYCQGEIDGDEIGVCATPAPACPGP
jgi:hypothetical protein